MKSRTIIASLSNTINAIVIAVVATSAMSSASANARGREDRRQTRQTVRIHDGRQSGELTNAEMKRVRMSGKAIKRAEKRFENNDGEIGEKEAIALEAMQDARSNQIHRLKNNDRVRDNESSAADSQ